MLLYQQVFGSSFDLGIIVPKSFVDQSYKHDVCPCFVRQLSKNQCMVLWIDYAEPEDRESLDSKRYTLNLHVNDVYARALFESDDLLEMTVVLESWSKALIV
ncbi:hypothetical protein [Endozoicomonas ascidiicola]|uniref:hypothetical protein n=1 Tax=Endozoicomonas ascidiicola TaxID=1698521 RepID=UPI00082DA3F7|nr:hypothetical protein [Endozoicomonas ascidiicola]